MNNMQPSETIRWLFCSRQISFFSHIRSPERHIRQQFRIKQFCNEFMVNHPKRCHDFNIDSMVLSYHANITIVTSIYYVAQGGQFHGSDRGLRGQATISKRVQEVLQRLEFFDWVETTPSVVQVQRQLQFIKWKDENTISNLFGECLGGCFMSQKAHHHASI